MTYETLFTTTDTVDTENHGRLQIEVEADSLGMATICFGKSFTLRMNEGNIDELRSILYDVSRRLQFRQPAPEAKYRD